MGPCVSCVFQMTSKPEFLLVPVDSVDWGPAQSQEEREYGQIERRIYLSYLRACGVTLGATYLIATVSWQGLRICTDYWLTEWTKDDGQQVTKYLQSSRLRFCFV